VRRDLLERALAYYQKFLKQRSNDPRVEHELAGAMFRVGQITELLESPSKALEPYETARTMQVRLLARRPNDPARLQALGNTLNALGTVLVKQKKYEPARTEYREAIRIRTRLAGTDAANSEYQRVVANTHMNLGLVDLIEGNLPAARLHFDEAQKIRQGALAGDAGNAKLRRDLGKGFFNLGNLDAADGKTDQAIQNFEDATAEFERLVIGQTPDLENQRQLALCYNRLADLLRSNRPDEARERYRQALDGLEKLAEQNPDVTEFQTERAGIYMTLSQLEFAADNGVAVMTNLDQARAILQPLVARFPAIPTYHSDLAITLRELAIQQHALAKAREDAKQEAQAREHLEESVRLWTDLAAKYPDEPAYAEELKITQEVVLSP
jgi:tetratricopeptide (TPR) repeat protein